MVITRTSQGCVGVGGTSEMPVSRGAAGAELGVAGGTFSLLFGCQPVLLAVCGAFLDPTGKEMRGVVLEEFSFF